MGIKSNIGVTCACLSVITFNVSAAIISADWNAVGDNLVTQDTNTGLEWLDLTATTSRSYNDISSKFGAGQEFEGWRYATATEISGFFDAFGGDSIYYTGWSAQNNGLFDAVSQYWGDTSCASTGCIAGDGFSQFYIGSTQIASRVRYGMIYDYKSHNLSATNDYVKVHVSAVSLSQPRVAMGSPLVRNSVVPVPAAMWLFGSGLLGLIGVARRKVRA